MLDFVLRIPFFYKYSELYKRQNRALAVLHGFTDRVIQRRRQELEEISINNNKSNERKEQERDDIGIRKKEALLDVLIKANINGKPLTDLEIREEVDTFMFEVSLRPIERRGDELTAFHPQGHDTTTSGITFSLFNIARNPEVQRKCFEEIRHVFGDDKNAPTTIKHLNDLRYLELVIKETLRIFPSVPFIGRQISEDVHLSKSRPRPKLFRPI